MSKVILDVTPVILNAVKDLRRATAMFVLLALAMTACGDGDRDADPASSEVPPTLAASPPPRPSSTPAPTTTPLAEGECPVQPAHVCAFALTLREAIVDGDTQVLVELGRENTYTCPEPAEGIDPLASLCEGAAPGDERRGYSLVRLQSEGAAVEGEVLRNALAGFTAQRRELPLATIGCPGTSADTLDCSNAFAIVFDGGEEVLMFVAEQTVEGPEIVRYITGVSALNQELITGGAWYTALDFMSSSPPAFFVPYSPGTTTAQTGASDCPVQPADVCAFALTLRDAIAAGDAQALVDLGRQVTYTCTGNDVYILICDGVPPGEPRSGYLLGRFQAETGWFDGTSLRSNLDEFIARHPDLEPVTIGCVGTGADALDCSGLFTVVFQDGDELLLFTADRSSAPPQVISYNKSATSFDPVFSQGGAWPSSVDFTMDGPSPAFFISYSPSP